MFGMTQTATRAPFGQRSGGAVDDGRIGKAVVLARRRDDCDIGSLPAISAWRLVVADGPQILQRLVERDHVGIFGIEIEQALLVRRRRAVADRLAHHHRTQAGLHRIDRGRPHAAAGGAAGDDQGVDLPAHQPRHQVGAEKAGGVFLHQQAVGRTDVEARIDLDRVGAGLERDHALLLERPDAGVLEVGLVVDHGREDHRDRRARARAPAAD